MIKLLFALPDSYNLYTLLFVALGSLATGLLFKKIELEKTKSKILRLENEKLANHSRILKLEKKYAELQKENTQNGPILIDDLQKKEIPVQK